MIAMLAQCEPRIRSAMTCWSFRKKSMSACRTNSARPVTTSLILLAVRLFILAAALMNSGAMTLNLLTFCNAFLGRVRVWLALVNVVQSVIFAGRSGSAIADAAGTGKMMERTMTEGGK